MGLQTILKVERIRDKSKDVKYYISSLDSKVKAKRFAYIIRSHWGIENSLHYCKDVIFNEDRSRLKTKNSAVNLSTMVSIVMNLLRQNNYSNLAQATRILSHDVYSLWNIISA